MGALGGVVGLSCVWFGREMVGVLKADGILNSRRLLLAYGFVSLVAM